MIERGEYDVVPDLAAVAEGYPAVILKVAASVDEHFVSYGDVLTEVRIERREDAERRRNPVAEQVGKQPAHFVRRMEGCVQPEAGHESWG